MSHYNLAFLLNSSFEFRHSYSECSPGAESEPADIMNQRHGHVLIFVKWLDPEKKRASFYEAAPFSKTPASERGIADLVTDGFVPLRYRNIRSQ